MLKLINYRGNKYRLVDWITAQMPAHETYVEPYGGGASVLLNKNRAKAEVYNDLNNRLVNLFQVMRNPEQAQRLSELMALSPNSEVEWLESVNISPDPVEDARRLMVRAGFHFGNLCHTNLDEYRYCWKNTGNRLVRQRLMLPPIHERLLHVTLLNWDALKVFDRFDGPETLFYVDPPYPAESKQERHKDYNDLMPDEDHVKMLNTLLQLEAKVMVSTYPNDMYSDILSGWYYKTKEIDIRSRGPRTRRTEALYMNDAATDNSQIKMIL